MKPIISTKGKFTQLRYELPHRVHDAKVYPVKAPNGSTIILYAHDSGVGVIWRGGRPLKQSLPPPKQPAKPAKVNGTSSDAIMIIDSDDDEPSSQAAPQAPTNADYDDEEEELDPDQPYQSIIQKIRLSLNTEVLHIATPHIPPVSPLRKPDTVPAIFSKKMVFTVACADYSVRVITIPLSPPSNEARDGPFSAKSQWGEEITRIPTHVGHQAIPRGVSMTWTSRVEPRFEEEPENDMEVDAGDGAQSNGRIRTQTSPSAKEGWDLLVASHSTELGGLLKIWRFGLNETSVTVKNPITAYQTLTLRTPATRIAFNSAQYPKLRHSQILITDRNGIARIYDPFAPSRKQHASSGAGAHVALFKSSFEQVKGASPPILAVRKPILDAAWASDGHKIVALLGDGEWGVWTVDRTATKLPTDPFAFAFRGFLASHDGSRSSMGASSSKNRNGSSALTPMTPNTRRTKQETLFQGATASSPTPARGCISIASLQSSAGDVPEDSLVITYGIETYRVADLSQHLARATPKNDGGPLLVPSLSQISSLSLFGESVTAVDQFDTTTREARMAIPRDILVSAEHRIIITTHSAEPLGRDLNAVFEKERAEEEETRRTDQALLVRGELDLGGMDRLLDGMDGDVNGQRSLVLGNARKVLFASSTS